ncbi:hypothetical protein GH714_010981 [Hevea brasiliensis]|uniref:Uncharacterized protein n=1 Tax=Hevea brasiliensis TaxID=3981 RepID=A0A6A6M6W9_HEVBR|nr:hypothetical protein GH714_010981 [Hevea brasiliensis]
MEKPKDFSIVEINASDPSLFPEKRKAASAKQFTWVLLLKAYKVLTCVSWFAMAFKSIFISIKKRIASSEMSEEEPRSRGRLYRFIKAFLAISIVALVIEVIAHFKKWSLNLINPWEIQGLVQWSTWLAPNQRRSSSWRQKGINIIYRHRLIRTGYKAGNLKSAMGCDYVQDYEFVAIFDADFQPNPDFLKQTIPHFKGNPDLGLVQARWSFVNKDENLLTRLQNINLCFHFEVEQQVNGAFLNFFGFNGTAGVWRIKALEDSGGGLREQPLRIWTLLFEHT